MTTVRYYAFITINTHRQTLKGALRFTPLLIQAPEALPLVRAAPKALGKQVDRLTKPQVGICEGREGALLPPSKGCHEQATFVEQVLQSELATKAQLTNQQAELLLQGAYDLEAKRRYILPDDRSMPAKVGLLPEDLAAELVRPDCHGDAKTNADVIAIAKKDPSKLFPPWKKDFDTHLLYREARQILLRVELDGPAILKITQVAQPDGRAEVETGTFLLPILDVP